MRGGQSSNDANEVARKVARYERRMLDRAVVEASGVALTCLRVERWTAKSDADEGSAWHIEGTAPHVDYQVGKGFRSAWLLSGSVVDEVETLWVESSTGLL